MDFKDDKNQKKAQTKKKAEVHHVCRPGEECQCGPAVERVDNMRDQYSQEMLQDCADQRENMLDESEQMYEQNDEPTERPKTNYD